MAASSRTGGLRRRGDAVVRRVLDETLQQLALVGFERLSIPEIAELSGVNRTSIYRRWSTKEELVRAALAHSMEHVRDVPDTGALRTDLLALIQIVGQFITSARGMGVVRTVFVDGDRLETPSIWQELGEDMPRVVIERAVRRGELSANADFELLLFTLAGAILHRVFVERRQLDDDFAVRLVNLVLDGAARR
ncbi:MAG TPA: TetR/AcrR family transcriptional regulator [Polyangium sp.]|nr:TetR/AcrR family transcriptional regulator [Polyangium sp.]